MGDSTTRGSCNGPSRPLPASQFLTTHWSVVLLAARTDTTRAQRALATLCQNYWQPLYAYVRRQGRSKEDAEDLVQGFFERFLAGRSLEGLSQEGGRFRAFLLASLKHYLANEWDRAHRQKRGGEVVRLSLDWETAERRCQLEPTVPPSPEHAFDREWAITLLGHALDRLAAECAADGKAELFQRLKVYLSMDRAGIPYAAAARELGLDEGAVRVAVHRLRRRYRALVREEISRTLASPDQVDEEMRALFAALTD